MSNDRRYESKDSLDIEKGSLPLRLLLWLDEAAVDGDLCQNDFFSGGDGGMYSPSPETELSLNSFGSSRRSFIPSANEGLNGLSVTGFTFSSVVVSAALLTGFLEVKGILKGAIVYRRGSTRLTS